MEGMNERILQLEAQMNALAQAWLSLAATVEIHGKLDLSGMQHGMLQRHWSRAPDIDSEAQRTMGWLCDQLDDARQARAREVHADVAPPADTAMVTGNVIAFVPRTTVCP